MESSAYEEFTRRWQAAGFASQQEAITHCLGHADWGEKPGQEGAVPGKYRGYLLTLMKILASGNDLVIKPVTATLDMAEFVLDASARKVPRERKPGGR